MTQAGFRDIRLTPSTRNADAPFRAFLLTGSRAEAKSKKAA